MVKQTPCHPDESSDPFKINSGMSLKEHPRSDSGKSLFSKLAFFASLFALGVIALGAFTRLMDAGLGCPDWPGCYGKIIAPNHLSPWIEMIHRYFVGILSTLIIIIIAAIFCKKMLRTRGNILLAISLIILLSYQIMLGQWTVTLKLLPIIVSQHLLGGYFILSILWLIYLNNTSKKYHHSSHQTNFLPWVLGGFFLLLLQIFLGAWTSTNYASLSCTDFPFCSNDQAMQWHFKEAFNLFAPIGANYQGGLLSTVIRETIQMTHRFGALALTLYFILLTAIAHFKLKQRPDLLKLFYVLMGFLFVQLCLGMSNIIFKLPLITALSHTIVAALLLVSCLTIIFQLNCDGAVV